MYAGSMKGRPLPRIQISHEMDSFERQRPEWTLYNSSLPTATGSSTWGLVLTLPEFMVNEVMGAQVDALCEDGANARSGYRERGLTTPSATSPCAYPS